MSNFVKIGTRRINLDLVTHVEERANGFIRAYLAVSSIDTQDFVALEGEEAALLLAAIDEDEEAFQATTRWAVNPATEREAGVICAIDRCGGWLNDQMMCERCGADHGMPEPDPDYEEQLAEMERGRPNLCAYPGCGQVIDDLAVHCAHHAAEVTAIEADCPF